MSPARRAAYEVVLRVFEDDAYADRVLASAAAGLDRRDFMMAEKLDCDRDGNIVLPDRPGLGAILDEDMLAKTRIE